MKVSRRNVLIAPLGILLVACTKGEGEKNSSPNNPQASTVRPAVQIETVTPTPTRPKADIYLEGDKSSLLKTIQDNFSKIEEIAKTRGKQLIVAFKNPEWETLKLSLTENNTVRLFREKTSEVAHMTVGMVGMLPGVKLEDTRGQIVERNNQLAQGSILTNSRDLEGILGVGAAVAGAALAVWIGATVGKFVLGIIGFIAVTALILGLVTATAAAVALTIKPVLNYFGITDQDMRDFGTRIKANLQSIFNSIETETQTR